MGTFSIITAPISYLVVCHLHFSATLELPPLCEFFNSAYSGYGHKSLKYILPKGKAAICRAQSQTYTRIERSSAGGPGRGLTTNNDGNPTTIFMNINTQIGVNNPEKSPENSNTVHQGAGEIDFFGNECSWNYNTKKKTAQDLTIFKMFLDKEGETRSVELIPPEELNVLISNFLMSVRKRDGTDYEASSLRAFISSIDRYLKMKKYFISIISDPKFSGSRDVLRSRQKMIRSVVKGNNPLTGNNFTQDELDCMYRMKAIGPSNPAALLHSMWLLCTGKLCMRPGKETHNLLWGDIALTTNELGQECIKYTLKRQLDFGIDIDSKILRNMNSIVLSDPSDSERDPVRLYKLYEEKRPRSMNTLDSPFFLTINRQVDPGKIEGCWYKKSPMGINKMYNLMKEIKAMAGLSTSVVTQKDTDGYDDLE